MSAQDLNIGLLICKRCKVRYAWASEHLAIKAERDRYYKALESVCNVGDRAAVLVAREALNAEAGKR